MSAHGHKKSGVGCWIIVITALLLLMSLIIGLALRSSPAPESIYTPEEVFYTIRVTDSDGKIVDIIDDSKEPDSDGNYEVVEALESKFFHIVRASELEFVGGFQTSSDVNGGRVMFKAAINIDHKMMGLWDLKTKSGKSISGIFQISKIGGDPSTGQLPFFQGQLWEQDITVSELPKFTGHNILIIPPSGHISADQTCAYWRLH